MFGADHVYRMDAAQMLAAHIERGAGVTVAGIRVPRAEASEFGVINTGADGPDRPSSWRSRPTRRACRTTPDESFASMGNYVFTTDVLVEALRKDAEDPDVAARHGRRHPPDAGRRGQGRRSTTSDNDVPGETDRDHGYWRDVGTLDAYYDAHMDLVSMQPVFNLYNRTGRSTPPRRSLPPREFTAGAALASESIVSAGLVLSGGRWTRSVLVAGRDRRAPVRRSSEPVIMDNCKIGANAVLRNAILDKNVVVPRRREIGVDPDLDRERGFTVSKGGVSVLGKGQVIEPPAVAAKPEPAAPATSDEVAEA